MRPGAGDGMDRHIEAFLEMIGAERAAARNTLLAYERDLADFTAFAAARGQKPAAVTADTLHAFMADLNKRGLKARTAARRLSALRQFHLFLLREGVRPDDPTDFLTRPKLPATLPKFLTEEEVDRLLAATVRLDERRGLIAAAALEILYASGMRISEMLMLPRTVLNNESMLVMVKGKGGKERLVPLSKSARAAAFAMTEGQDKRLRWLFPGRNPVKPMTRQTFFLLLKDLAEEAGINPARVSPHVLRHSFASHMLARGADLRSLQILLGHADIATTQIYTHVMHERLRELLLANHPLMKPWPEA
jgi:integrase/recombinase XerD